MRRLLAKKICVPIAYSWSNDYHKFNPSYLRYKKKLSKSNFYWLIGTKLSLINSIIRIRNCKNAATSVSSFSNKFNSSKPPSFYPNFKSIRLPKLLTRSVYLPKHAKTTIIPLKAQKIHKNKSLKIFSNKVSVYRNLYKQTNKIHLFERTLKSMNLPRKVSLVLLIFHTQSPKGKWQPYQILLNASATKRMPKPMQIPIQKKPNPISTSGHQEITNFLN